MHSQAANFDSHSLPAKEFQNFVADRERISKKNSYQLSFFKSLVADLSNENIPCVPLKGLDLLLRAYPSHGMRDMADIDLLIPPDKVRAAQIFFQQRGYTEKADEGLTFLTSGQGIALDIIWKFWYFKTPQQNKSLWDHLVLRNHEGFTFKTLHPHDAFIYLVAYTTAHRAVLSETFVEDLKIFLIKEGHGIKWDELLNTIKGLHMQTFFFHGLSYALQKEKLEIPEFFMSKLTPMDFSEKLAYFFYQRLITETAQPKISYLQTWLSYPGFSGKLRLAREKLLPTPLELEIQRHIKSRVGYAAYILFHPFILIFRGVLLGIRDLVRLCFKKH